MASVSTRADTADKLEYVYFILIVGRLDLHMYWTHLRLWQDNVIVHDMWMSIPPGYCTCKVTFQESVSTGYHSITSCSAEELYEDKRFARSFFPVFLQLHRSIQKRYGFHFFKLISKVLFEGREG